MHVSAAQVLTFLFQAYEYPSFSFSSIDIENRYNSQQGRRFDIACWWWHSWSIMLLWHPCRLLCLLAREWKTDPWYDCAALESVICISYFLPFVPQMGMRSCPLLFYNLTEVLWSCGHDVFDWMGQQVELIKYSKKEWCLCFSYSSSLWWNLNSSILNISTTTCSWFSMHK